MYAHVNIQAGASGSSGVTKQTININADTTINAQAKLLTVITVKVESATTQIKFGLTSGGNEVAEINDVDVDFYYSATVNYQFQADTVQIYISGITTDTEINFYYL